VPAGTKGDKAAGVVVKMLDPAMLASTIHAGAYDKVGETYGKLAKWVVENKYEFAGPALEFYTSPENTPVESLKTEVCFIVKTAAPAADSGKAAPSEEKKEEPKKGLKGPTTK
jgi:DNA gyrase inhibitor GyrI